MTHSLTHSTHLTERWGVGTDCSEPFLPTETDGLTQRTSGIDARPSSFLLPSSFIVFRVSIFVVMNKKWRCRKTMMIHPAEPFLLFSLFVLVAVSHADHALLKIAKETKRKDAFLNEGPSQQHLNMTLCTGRCEGDCVSYITPLQQCYSPSSMYPDDASWSEFDVLDELLSEPSLTFQRTVFPSIDGICRGGGSNPNDIFIVPLEVCVGPFGKPRPWGSFVVL
jgi:hypothetical protein